MLLNVLLYDVDTHVTKDIAILWESLELGTKISNLTVCGSCLEHSELQGIMITVYGFKASEPAKSLRRIPI